MLSEDRRPKSPEEILREEAEAIHGREKVRSAEDKNLYRMLGRLDSAALCLSGGGIRSAAFALGVIQALATHPRPSQQGNAEKHQPVDAAENSLIAKFHYLSTVSGGGYIGSWLSAWITRVGFSTVWKNLVTRPAGPDTEPPNLAWLRTYSNYLTPKLGATSADAWAAVATYIRNLVLNWIVILPVLFALLILLKGYAILTAWIGRFSPGSCIPLLSDYNPTATAGIEGVTLLVVALSMRQYFRPTRGHSWASQSIFLFCDLVPTVLGASLIVLALAPSCLHDLFRDRPLFDWTLNSIIPIGAMGGAVIYAVSWFAGRPKFRSWLDFVGDLIAWLVAGVIFGALLGVGLHFAQRAYDTQALSFGPSEILFLVCGVPWILAAQLISEIIFIGLTSWEEDSDADREWLARAGGWLAVVASCWLIAMALVFLGSAWLEDLYSRFQAWIVPAGGVSGAIMALLGKSGLTQATSDAKSQKPRSGLKLSADLVLAIAALVFAVALVVLTSALIDQIAFQQSLIKVAAFRESVAETGYADRPAEADKLFWSFVVVIAIGIVSSKFVNINRFSLHALYRNRIVRAFLGASNPKRADTRNPFTDFDEQDNLPVWKLWPNKGDAERQAVITGAGWRPFHVINIALNIVSSKNLAWQERKAEPFTVSPLHSGSACKAYRSSKDYGHKDRGISLGTAVAISGAAASPNMGYHSSPAITLLLALFNVRLGWWLGNPGKEGNRTYRDEGPRTAIRPLISEMFGLTTDDNKYIYLSDGGHFENLGLYEMVRRRCRLIIVSDAGCDPKFAFEDLGNAVRKIAIDLGVRIEFHGIEKLKTRTADDDKKTKREALIVDAPYHAIGTIYYAEADGAEKNGVILYIKPAYHGTEDVGVRSYATANLEFPHQTTGDQWFSESQFESYRALGFQITDALLIEAFSQHRPKNWTIEEICTALSSVSSPRR